MRVAIDWSTVVDTDKELWAAFIKEAAFRGHDPHVLFHAVPKEEDVAYIEHLGAVVVRVPRFSQAQDIIGADIWVHGRVDRVLGVQQVDYLHREINEG